MSDLAANEFPFFFLTHLWTTPLDPSPIFSLVSYFSAKSSTCSKLLCMDDDDSTSMLN